MARLMRSLARLGKENRDEEGGGGGRGLGFRGSFRVQGLEFRV